nr:T9SS type A sorting domain-containing protein [Lacibacter sp.]
VFNSNASYTYNGNTDQVTGTGLPTTVLNLSISSNDISGNSTVALTNNNTTVTNSFNLNNGYFAAGTGGNLQIASGGTIFGTGGHNPNSATAGNIIFLGSGSTIGTLTGYPRLYSVILNGAVDFNGTFGQSATILNKLQLNSGSYVSDAPYYSSGSSLVYSTGGTYNRNVEWGAGSDQGYPHHVTVQAGTIVDLNSNSIGPAQLEIGGDFTIGNANGSGQVYMNNNMSKPLSVKGNLIIGSTNAAANGSILWLSSANGGDLWLEGSFTRYNNGSYNDNERAIFFKGTANASINTPNVTITPGTPTQYFSYALMDKTNGTEIVTLNCPVGIDHAMTFTKGIILSSTNHPLVFVDNATVSGASDLSFVSGPVKKIGDDVFTFPVGKPLLSSPNVGGYRLIGITPFANTNPTDAFTAEFMQASATALGPIGAVASLAGLTRVSRCEYWMLDKTNGAGNLAVHVTASWAARSNCNISYVSSLPDLAIAHFNNSDGEWDTFGANAVTGNVTAGTITWNNVSTFSPFSLASTDFIENLLPLDVSGFTARARKTDVAIDWMISNNNDQDEFILERSKDGIRFEILKVVPAKVILFTATYAEEDRQPFNGWNYYRLRSIDKIGKERISKIVKVWFGRSQEIRISPNPASEKIMVSFAAPSSISQIELVNISGQVLQRIKTIQFINEVNISHLQAGMYYLRISGKNGLSTTSFIKQ